MEDREIVSLFRLRSERALKETAAKYAAYCQSIAQGILRDEADAQECVNDAYLRLWNSIPPNCPAMLSTYLGKIVRRVAIDMLRRRQAERRGGGELPLVLDELAECVPSARSVEQTVEDAALAAAVKDFLGRLPEAERRVFLCRYWYLDSISTISQQFHYSESKVKSMLARTRKKLLTQLQREGFCHDK